MGGGCRLSLTGLYRTRCVAQPVDGEATAVKVASRRSRQSRLVAGRDEICVRDAIRIVLCSTSCLLPDGGNVIQSSRSQPAWYQSATLDWRRSICRRTSLRRTAGSRCSVRADLVRGTTEEISSNGGPFETCGLREFDVDSTEVVAFHIGKPSVATSGWQGRWNWRLSADGQWFIKRRPLWSGHRSVNLQSNRGGQHDIWESSVTDGRVSTVDVHPTTHERPEGVCRRIARYVSAGSRTPIVDWDQTGRRATERRSLE